MLPLLQQAGDVLHDVRAAGFPHDGADGVPERRARRGGALVSAGSEQGEDGTLPGGARPGEQLHLA